MQASWHWAAVSLFLLPPPAEAPVEMSVPADGQNHNVYVFGTALALVSTDGSIDISSLGPVGRVDVMIDGVVTKNVASVDIPTGQRTRMALEEGSVVVKNVTAEAAETIRTQVEAAYAAGTASADLTPFTDMAVYKVNAAGDIVDANGRAASAGTSEMSVSSVSAAAETFTEVMEERIAEDKVREAEEAVRSAEAARAAAEAAAQAESESSSSCGSGGYIDLGHTILPGEGTTTTPHHSRDAQ